MATDLSGILYTLVISIRPIRYEGKPDGYRVRVTSSGRSVTYVYAFPADRASDVLNAVLTQIGTEHANSASRGR